MEYWLKRYNSLIKNFEEQEQTKIPLCAAETYTSDFSLKALNSHIEGKYGFGTNDFIGGNIVLELKKLCSDLCKEIFKSKYSNFDTMTGMSSITYTIMALLNFGDKVLITTPNQGGHPSLPIILETLGINFGKWIFVFHNFFFLI